MNFWQMICALLDSRCERPAMYGPYHLFCLLLTAALTVLAVHMGRRHDAKQVNRVLLGTAVLVIVLEIYKQFNYTFGNGLQQPHYQWYAFPFQFCSTPMYLGLLAALLRRGRVHDSLCAYLCTYAVFAGAGVMLYPNTVFIDIIGINIQTMICHGSMPPIAALLLASRHVKPEKQTILKALPVFLCCVGIAAIMNEIAYFTGILEEHTFNMFYISPHCQPSLPVYSLVQNVLPFPVCLIVYVLGFTAAAFIMLLLAMGMGHLAKISHKGSAKQYGAM